MYWNSVEKKEIESPKRRRRELNEKRPGFPPGRQECSAAVSRRRRLGAVGLNEFDKLAIALRKRVGRFLGDAGPVVGEF